MNRHAPLFQRAVNKINRFRSSTLASNFASLTNSKPVISFTFDDFPKNAADVGAAILEQNGVRGTFYVSLGLLGRTAPTGLICSADAVASLHEKGHEIGCHTFDHLDAWTTYHKDFLASINRNANEILTIIPGHKFATLSYPISSPHPAIKRRCGKIFQGCRGGGQLPNFKRTDLNRMNSFFLEKVGGNFDLVRSIIKENYKGNGWLIFSTHDIDQNPTRYGCTPSFFEAVVRESIGCGAEILPVAEVLHRWANNTSRASSN